MEIDLETNDRGARCVLRGEIDLATAADVERVLVGLCRPGNSLTIDCTGVTFIDSVGLRTMLVVRDAARRAGTSLLLHGVPRTMRRLLEIAGLHDAFRIVDGQTTRGALPSEETS